MCVRSGRCLAGVLTVFLLSAVPSGDARAQAGALSVFSVTQPTSIFSGPNPAPLAETDAGARCRFRGSGVRALVCNPWCMDAAEAAPGNAGRLSKRNLVRRAIQA